MKVQKVRLPPAGRQEVLSGLSSPAPARRAWRPLLSQNRSCHRSPAEAAQCAAVSSGQQEEQRTVPVHRPQLVLSARHHSHSGIQEGAVCRYTQVRGMLMFIYIYLNTFAKDSIYFLVLLCFVDAGVASMTSHIVNTHWHHSETN